MDIGVKLKPPSKTFVKKMDETYLTYPTFLTYLAYLTYLIYLVIIVKELKIVKEVISGDVSGDNV